MQILIAESKSRSYRENISFCFHIRKSFCNRFTNASSGTNFLEAGFIYAPYVPLVITPTI